MNYEMLALGTASAINSLLTLNWPFEGLRVLTSRLICVDPGILKLRGNCCRFLLFFRTVVIESRNFS